MAQQTKDRQPQLVDEALRMVSFTLTCAAAGDYTAGNVLSASASDGTGTAAKVKFGGIGEIFRIHQVIAVCSEDDVRARLRMHAFNVQPAAADVEMDDRSAFNIKTATGYGAFVASATLQPFADRGVPSISETNLIDVLMKSLDGFLYWVIEAAEGESSETAGMTIRFDIYYS